MYFDSLQAALMMDGHGVYVWSAYGLSLLVLGVLVLLPLLGKRRFMRELRAETRREIARQQYQAAQSSVQPPPIHPATYPPIQSGKESAN